MQVVDRLLEAGELDIYTETKHQMEREAALYAKPTLLESDPTSPPQSPLLWPRSPRVCAPIHTVAFACAFPGKPGDSDGDDMFAEDSDGEKDEPPAKRHAPEPPTAASEPAPAAASFRETSAVRVMAARRPCSGPQSPPLNFPSASFLQPGLPLESRHGMAA